MAISYIGLGSNLGEREDFIWRAVHELRAFARLRRISSLTETKPVGNTAQPDFINAVAEIETDHSPAELLQELQRIEGELGRVRGERGGPRNIDLDLLAYGNEVYRGENLRVPHPRMHERRFVLEPLAELNPGWVHPEMHTPISELLKRLPEI